MSGKDSAGFKMNFNYSSVELKRSAIYLAHYQAAHLSGLMNNTDRLHLLWILKILFTFLVLFVCPLLIGSSKIVLPPKC